MSDPRETPVTVQTFLNQGSEKADGSSNQLSQASGSKGPTGSQNGPRSKKGPAEQRKEESTPSQPAKIDNNQTQELTSMLNVLGFQLGEGSQQPANVDLIDQLSNMGFGQEE